MRSFGHRTDCAMQNAQLGYNYLKYDSGWPVVLEGIVIASDASILSRLPGWSSLLILSGMWTLIACPLWLRLNAIGNLAC